MKPSSRLRSLLRFAAIFCLLLAVIGALGPQTAFAELRYTTSYRENPIRGVTPAQLWRNMGRHPIIDEDGPALANITHDHKLTVKTEKTAGVCRVSGLDFSWKFVITLPKAVDEAAMNRKTRAIWREFVAYLKRHEEHHRTIFLACGRSFVAEAETFTTRGSCPGLQRKVTRFVNEQYDVCMTKQRAFDRTDRSALAKLAFHRAHKK